MLPPPPPPSGADGGGGGKGWRRQTGSGRGGFWSGRLNPVGSSEWAEARAGKGREAGGERRAFLSNELPIGDAASLASASAANQAPSLRFPPSSRTSSGKRSPERKTICALTGRGGDVKRAAVRSLPVVKSDACRLPLELKTSALQEIQSRR